MRLSLILSFLLLVFLIKVPGQTVTKQLKGAAFSGSGALTGLTDFCQLPYSLTYQLETSKEKEEIILVPYGCTNLRISQFPVLRK
ncbi:MAG: hypothetical protein ABIP35_00345 [Ginsengibacter sp.]